MGVRVTLISLWEDDEGGKAVFERPGRYIIGRSADTDFRIHDRMVSRQHCALIIDERGARMRDLGSTNGIIVDETPVGGFSSRTPYGDGLEDTEQMDALRSGVPPIEEAPLMEGSIIELGTSRIRVSLEKT